MPTSDSVEIHQGFERGWNRLQAIIEVLVGVVILLGLAGLFGTGPLARAELISPSGKLTISYDHIARRTNPSEITFAMLSADVTSPIDLVLPSDFLQTADVSTTSPRALAMRSDGSEIIYTFDLGRRRGGTITLRVKPKTFGLIRAKISVGSEMINFQQLILP